MAGPNVYLKSDRLLLRQWQEADKPLMGEMQTDPEWMAHFPAVRTAEESDKLVDKLAAEIAANGYGFFALERKKEGDFIGFTGLRAPGWQAPFTPCIEIGWGIAKDCWGRGYASEAALRCLKFAGEDLDLKEVFSFTTPANTPSRAVMERIGMERVKGGDFMHPEIDPASPFARHVLYRIKL